jgi:predicted membrane-bound spermidine synthase
MAITKQTTKCAGKERVRHSWLFVCAIASSIAFGGMAASIAFTTLSTSMTGDEAREVFQVHQLQFWHLGTRLSLPDGA